MDDLWAGLYPEIDAKLRDERPAPTSYRADERVVLDAAYGPEIFIRNSSGEWQRVADDRAPVPFDPTAPDAYLGPTLRRARDLAGIPQRTLALRAGVTQSAVSRLERRSREPSWQVFCRLLAGLGLRPVVSTEPVETEPVETEPVETEPVETEPVETEPVELGRPTSVTAVADDTSGGGFETRAIHAGQEPDRLTGAVVPPVYLTSTYAQDGVGGRRGGYEYSRSANPTRAALETCLAALEGGAHGFAFASGLAAEDTLLRAVCRPGDHVVIPGDAYGGTYRLFATVLERWGLTYTTLDQRDPDAVRQAVRDTTRLVWCETPTNPLLGVTDIATLAAIAHEQGARLVVDNTFASPYLQQPLRLGADIVVHSTTKYLGGHSDVVGGALVVADPAVAEAVGFHQNAMGGVAGPFDAWLVLRGVKTLGVRMDRHCDNAERIVALLRAHDAVTSVLYPDDDPVAAKQMRRFGGMVSFRVVGGEAQALDVCGRTRLFTLAESLGGVESLIEHPARMTHASAAGSPLEVPRDLIRLSVGIESVEDLLDDLGQALA